MFDGLSFAFCYFIPTLIAWYRRKSGNPTVGSLGQIFFLNLIAGFTIIGWFLALANALNHNPVAKIAPGLANFLVKYGRTGAPPPPAAKTGAPAGSPSSASCGQCGGSGSVAGPSGRIQCMACGGSGRIPSRA